MPRRSRSRALRRTRALLPVLGILIGAPVGAEPPGEALDEALLGRMIGSFVRSRADDPVREIAIPSLERFALAGLDDFDVALSALPEQPMRGSVPLTLAVSSGGETLRSGVVTVRVDAERKVVVARRALRRGAVLQAADLVVEPRVVDERSEDWLEKPGAAVGKRLRRTLAAGAPVRAAQLEPVPVVRRGERVKLELRHGRLRIEGYGQARQDGGAGEWIRVRNLVSRREVIGRVGEDGVVHVRY